jgi:CheY-like chemotaxis protein
MASTAHRPSHRSQESDITPDKPARSAAGEVILAVDDNADVRRAVLFQLKQLGYEVREADNAHAALAIINSDEKIDLLFTDMVMPGGMNGKELATSARARRPGLKVLFTSGFTGEPTSKGTELEDCDVLLSKPYRRDDLAKALRDMLDTDA